LTKTATKTNNK